jgi:hypothetical protein
MMAISAFPSSGWTHAYRHATWLKNRLPTKRLDGDTPYYRMFGKNYNMSNVRIFGCRAFAHIPSAQRTKLEPRAAEGVYVGHDDASSAYLIYASPQLTEDVDAYASRLIDSTSVPALPVDPTELFYDKPAPFHDTVNPKTNFDVVGLGAWYSHEDHELISMVQLQPTSSDQLQPAATSGDQPEPDFDSFGTTLTRYVSDPSPLLPSRFKAVLPPSHCGGIMAPWDFYPLFSTN